MKFNLGRAALIVSFLSFSVSAASAAMIDFTNVVAFGGAEGQMSFNSPVLVDGAVVTVQGFSGGVNTALSFNAGTAQEPECTALGLLACGGDGLGVLGRENDEIDLTPTAESILVSFSTPLSINRLGVLDAFVGGNPNVPDGITEIISYTVKFADLTTVDGSFTATDSTTALGFASQNVSFSNVGSIRFFGSFAPPSPCPNADNCSNDFALAFISTGQPTTVPEPASMFLLGSGLAGLAAYKRRRAA